MPQPMTKLTKIVIRSDGSSVVMFAMRYGVVNHQESFNGSEPMMYKSSFADEKESL